MRMSFTSRPRDLRGRAVRRTVESVEPAAGMAAAAVPVEAAAVDEHVDEDTTRPPTARGWYASSLDLRHGLEVSDVPLDTLPDDLISGFTKW